jgi:sialic acid synthase SpsE/D-lyxose ketol-isomerase
MKDFDFDGLFTFDMANNHQGDLKHGIRIIQECGKVAAETGVKAALKFQFRNVETLIHPEFKDREDIPHIPRFMQTALGYEEHEQLVGEVRKAGMMTMTTPFDEESVGLAEQLDIEVLKIASCSADDYPLLDEVVRVGHPIVVSTAGLSMNKIDRLVSFLEEHRAQFALMHCVALYPTPKEKLNLNQIALLRERFPRIPVGFSTHEHPDNLDAVRIAYAKGARLFERHVGILTDKYDLNSYSSTPDQLRAWIFAYQDSLVMCGGEERSPADQDERKSLQSLMRGVYAGKDLVKGENIARGDVFFAMPLQTNQFASGQWRKGLTADRNYRKGEPLVESLADFSQTQQEIIYQILLQVKGMLNQARISIRNDYPIELSHHYGLDRFREFGAVIIDCVNRTYCKKLIIMLPRQKHPYHYHKMKEETFQLLDGDMEIVLDGHRTRLSPGDTFLVLPGQWHKFHTLGGAVVEEISTTHYNDDSFYDDEQIAKIPREKRKTSIENWSKI